jgi:hypothetical protein
MKAPMVGEKVDVSLHIMACLIACKVSVQFVIRMPANSGKDTVRMSQR